MSKRIGAGGRCHEAHKAIYAKPVHAAAKRAAEKWTFDLRPPQGQRVEWLAELISAEYAGLVEAAEAYRREHHCLVEVQGGCPENDWLRDELEKCK